jgi:hypothetical protein
LVPLASYRKDRRIMSVMIEATNASTWTRIRVLRIGILTR